MGNVIVTLLMMIFMFIWTSLFWFVQPYFTIHGEPTDNSVGVHVFLTILLMASVWGHIAYNKNK